MSGGAGRLREMVAEAANVPVGRGPDMRSAWERADAADDWLKDHAPELAALVADMAEAIEQIRALAAHNSERHTGFVHIGRIAAHAQARLDSLLPEREPA